MVRLSVNVNKVATLRNSRTPPGGEQGRSGMGEPGSARPSVRRAVDVCLAAGAPGITVHPRADARHITIADAREIGQQLAGLRSTVEYNIEGDPRPDLVDVVQELRPHQFTLVPVRPGEVTSQAGWPPSTPTAELRALVERVHEVGTRVSIFVDPDPAAIGWAAELGADRVELFTEPYARAFEQGLEAGRRSFETYARMAELAHVNGLGVNAGHDLDERNLPLFRDLPHLAEVSIGHALVAEALFDGLDRVVRRYLQLLT